MRDKTATWTQNRSFEFFEKQFGQFVGGNLEDFLVKIGKRKRRPLRVFDDGAGVGFFLYELKKNLRKRGISTFTSGIVFDAHPDVIDRVKRREIDKIYDEKSEFFVPGQKQDVIFSLFGSVHYTMKEFEKEILLKYCHSLNYEGYALIGDFLHKKLSYVGKRNLKRKLKKLGFEITFGSEPDAYYLDLADDIIIIRRLTKNELQK